MSGAPRPDLLDEVRASCARVAAVAAHVHIDHDRLAAYAEEIDIATPPPDPGQQPIGDDESTAAFVLSLDAINFGSGYFPWLRKRPGHSGYHTVAAGLRDHVATHGPVSAAWLRDVDESQCAVMFGQELDGGPAHELMGLFAGALRDLGEFVRTHGGDSFVATVDAAGGSAPRLVELLTEMPFYRDVHEHPSGPVTLLKRAQITAHDLYVAFEGRGPGALAEVERLTMFPDNLVPHVLRVDGILRFDEALVERIEAVDDITVGSTEEVEIRACGVHAVELLVAELDRRGRPTTAGRLDNVLWNRGGGARYKARPRHRSRCVFY